MNLQTGNVGNLGDILKHAALVQLALALQKRAGQDSCYVETHSFLLQAPIRDNGTWEKAVARLSETLSGYKLYAEIEQPLIDKQEYRCSAGLVLDLLQPSSAYLAEIDPATRQTLSDQVVAEGRGAIVTLTEAAEQLPIVIDRRPRSAFLMLVDPFEDPNEVWPIVSRVVDAVGHQGLVGAIEVFAYGDVPVIWPDPPTGFAGPVSTMNKIPYQLALYATKLFEAEALGATERLGWTSGSGEREEPT